MPLAPGTTFDRYTVEALLGAGGMGSVYRALDTKLHRRVALKVLDAEMASSSDAAARMLREARAAAQLDHPNAIAIFDVGEHEGAPYIAMELIAGHTLREVLAQEGPPAPFVQRLRWLIDVARALSAAHTRGIVHRDIKPENVMLRDDGVVKVLDFGIARLIDTPADANAPTSALQALTGKGVVIGTPRYMAPEQLRGDAIDGRADQFAWGVMAYEVLTGNPPWTLDASGTQLVAEIVSLQPPSLSTRVPGVPAVVDAVVMRALAKSREARFASMDEAVHAIEGVGVSQHGVREGIATAPTERFQAFAPNAVSTKTATATETAAEKVASPARRRASLYGLIALIVAAAAATPIWLAAGRKASAPSIATTASGSASSSSSAATTSRAFVDAPPPQSSIKGAISAYADAMRALRDSELVVARTALEKATDLDPLLAAGHLHMALVDFWLNNPVKGKAEVARATELKAKLSDRESAILSFVSAYSEQNPPSLDDLASRLRDASLRFSNDGELAFDAVVLAYERGDAGALATTSDALLALDPSVPEGFNARGVSHMWKGEIADAVPAFDQCVRVVPLSGECRSDRLDARASSGDAVGQLADAREWVVRQPEAVLPYVWLARALADDGATDDAIMAALQQSWDRDTADATRDGRKVSDTLRLALRKGDFASALAGAQQLERLAGTATDLAAEPARIIVEIDLETGHVDAAAVEAASFLARPSSWAPLLWHDEGPVRADPTPAMLAAEVRGGKLPASRFHDERDAWVKRWRDRAPEGYEAAVWFHGWGDTVATREDALEALAALRDFEPMTGEHDVREQTALGATLLLAGRTDEATLTLQTATKICASLSEPFASTRAHALLGQALEAGGDSPGACAEYAVVVARWGGAKPASMTADLAKGRLAALHCAK